MVVNSFTVTLVGASVPSTANRAIAGFSVFWPRGTPPFAMRYRTEPSGRPPDGLIENRPSEPVLP